MAVDDLASSGRTARVAGSPAGVESGANESSVLLSGSVLGVEQQLAFLSAFFDRSQDAVAFVDRGLIFCTANTAFARRLGLSAAGIVGRRAEDLLPGLKELAKLEVAAAKENLDPCTGVSQSRSGDVGNPGVRASVSNVMCAGGSCLGYMVCLQDLDEGKRAEDALRASEARLLTAQRSAHIGNWERNLQTNELWWSDEDFRILGLDPSQVSPSFEAFMAVVDPVDHDFVRRSVADAYDNSKAFDIDVRIIRPGGSRGVVNARSDVLFDDAGKPRLMTGTVQDISSRKRAEDALTRFKLGIERSSEAIFMTDTDGAITYANPAFEAIFGYTPDEAEPKPTKGAEGIAFHHLTSGKRSTELNGHGMLPASSVPPTRSLTLP